MGIDFLALISLSLSFWVIALSYRWLYPGFLSLVTGSSLIATEDVREVHLPVSHTVLGEAQKEGSAAGARTGKPETAELQSTSAEFER